MEKNVSAARPPVGKMTTMLGKRLSVQSRLTAIATPTIVETPALCGYARHVCMRNRLEGYEFCSRHILEDKSSPFRQCSYTYTKTGRRCREAVLRTDRRDGFCNEHAHKLMLARKHSGAKKSRPQDTPQGLLSEIECHLGASSKSSGGKPAESIHSHCLVNDTSSGSEDELSDQLMHSILSHQDDIDSDAESIDSEQENALKHAGVYTAEEVALIFRDKLIRLQSLYIDQFKRLHHRLREKRREYLHATRSSPDEVPLNEASANDANSKAIQDKLSALRRYQRRFGKEALLMRQLKERRIAVYEGDSHKPPRYEVCEHMSDGVSCSDRALPLSKYCLKHILSDTNQVLYVNCDYGTACRQPVASTSCSPRCSLHMQSDPSECRYSIRELEDNKEETVDVVSVSDVKD